MSLWGKLPTGGGTPAGSLRVSPTDADDLVRGRLRLYRDAGITTLRASLHGGPDTELDRLLGDLERLLDLVRQVNDETTGARVG